jgi:hypothetical protein
MYTLYIFNLCKLHPLLEKREGAVGIANDVARLAEERIGASTCRICCARDWFPEVRYADMHELCASKKNSFRERLFVRSILFHCLPTQHPAHQWMLPYVHMSICLFPFSVSPFLCWALFPACVVSPCQSRQSLCHSAPPLIFPSNLAFLSLAKWSKNPASKMN